MTVARRWEGREGARAAAVQAGERKRSAHEPQCPPSPLVSPPLLRSFGMFYGGLAQVRVHWERGGVLQWAASRTTRRGFRRWAVVVKG